MNSNLPTILNRPKFQIIFHKKIPPLDFIRKTLLICIDPKLIDWWEFDEKKVGKVYDALFAQKCQNAFSAGSKKTSKMLWSSTQLDNKISTFEYF